MIRQHFQNGLTYSSSMPFDEEQDFKIEMGQPLDQVGYDFLNPNL